jgi:xyloglucan-specific exo-beta-1,4-glucanase
MFKALFIRTLGAFALLLTLAFPLTPSDAQAQAYNWRNVEIVGGGFVPGIVFNQSEPDLIYARTDIGGAYRWNPTTNRWIPLLDWVGFDDWNLTEGRQHRD